MSTKIDNIKDTKTNDQRQNNSSNHSSLFVPVAWLFFRDPPDKLKHVQSER